LNLKRQQFSLTVLLQDYEQYIKKAAFDTSEGSSLLICWAFACWAWRNKNHLLCRWWQKLYKENTFLVKVELFKLLH